MKDFMPNKGTIDIDGKFFAFIQSKVSKDTHRLPSGSATSPSKVGPQKRAWSQVDQDPLGSFVQKWGLDGEAADLLYELPPNVQEDVMSSFAPRDKKRDTNSLFVAFAKTRKPKHQEIDPQQAFVQKWGLNDQAANFLWDMPADARNDVIASFAPRQDTRDVSNLFMSFAKKRKHGQADAHQEPDQLQAFVETWGLNDEASGLLRELPWNVQEEVVSAFAPNEKTRDISNLFVAFAKKRRNRQGDAQHTDPRQAFLQKWGLGDQASRVLYDLPENLQKDVMGAFSPKHGAQGLERLFISFASTRRPKPMGADTMRPKPEGADTMAYKRPRHA